MSEAPVVDQKLTRKVAELARLELSDAEVGTFTKQLGDILHYVDQLQEVDVTGVEPLYHPFEASAQLREDVARPFESAKLLERAPETWDDSYRVPPIIG